MGILDKVQAVNAKHKREQELEKSFVEQGFRSVCNRDFLRKQKKGGGYRQIEKDQLHNNNSRKLS